MKKIILVSFILVVACSMSNNYNTPFINVDDKIILDTRTLEYVKKIK